MHSGLRRTDAEAVPAEAASISRLGREFLDYWHARAPEDGFPGRSDIRPEELKGLLPYFFMVDVLREGGRLDFRFRLIGTEIMRIEGEHTGLRLSEMFPDRKAYSVLWRQYQDAVAGRIWVRRETLRWQDREHVNYEVILAPLQDDKGEVHMLIGLAHAKDG